MKGWWLAILLSTLAACSTESSEPPISEQAECVRSDDMPESYRLAHYRAPTPECVPDGITVNTEQLRQLIATHSPVLIDVLSVMRRPDADFGGAWLPNEERWSLPGSIWLPNVGYGELDEEMQHYFRSQLERLTQGNKDKPLVFFCIVDCWMSWNALLRAHSYGYSNLYWYKNGTDDWSAAGLGLQKIDPVPLKAMKAVSPM